jgi:hypothetical protein
VAVSSRSTTALSNRSQNSVTPPPLPWFLWAVVLASTSVIVGLLWDISWHRTIGRDRFLTPAHIAIYLGGLIAGLSCGWLALQTTFGRNDKARLTREAGVGVWGFRGSLGGWICIWGTFAMLTSAPFDNWWHGAYGLDVKILSPPHVLLGLGMIGIEVGAMIMVLAYQNRSAPAYSGPRLVVSDAKQHTRERILAWMFLYTSGIALLMAATLCMENIGFANAWHNAVFAEICAGVFPVLLAAVARAGRIRWSATAIAGVYTGITLLMMWVLQASPATAKLAPIYNPVTHMVPPPFPLLLLVPAVAFDLLVRRFEGRSDWLLAAVLGVLFVAVTCLLHWFFAKFLISPAARNFVFGADQWDYNSRLGPWRYRFWALDVDKSGEWSAALYARGVCIATVLGIVSARLGLGWGRWMSRVVR